MVVGVMQVELRIEWAESLKDKRRVVKSLKDRLHREHLVSVAEVAALETPTVAVLGIAAVGHDGQRVGETLDRISAKLLTLHDADVAATTREMLHGIARPEHKGAGAELDEDAIARELLGRELGIDEPGAGGPRASEQEQGER
ncbi:MAG: DUF503 domain-containing protein [Phycisphaerales bacterium]|nr:MAG: DUF503 domain-containing protein [Phycisphaerales bacterium]